MQFTSVSFLFLFFPATLLLFRLLPTWAWSGFFVLASLIFYALSASPLAAAVLVCLTVVGWFAQRRLGRVPSRGLLAGLLAFFAGVLAFCKLFRGGAYLSPGMSFYLFQLSAILIDVFRGKLPAQPLLPFFEQVVFFPKLLSGPLVSPEALARQQANRRFSLENVYEGVRVLILGLSMKVLLANRLGGLWAESAVIGYANLSTGAAWLALVGYTMELFLDFWGYSLMAMGIGRAFGYTLPENFLDPYTARSVSEFYRRWHATLGAWFREYVYFPLGGSRRGSWRTLANLAIVWLFTGFWHGVGGGYVLWAMFLLCFLVLERCFLGKWLEKRRILSHIYVLLVVMLSWIPFAIGDFGGMLTFLGRLFGVGEAAPNAQPLLPWLRMYAPLLAVGGLLMTGLPRRLWLRFRRSPAVDVLLFALFWLSVYAITTAAQDPFLYFQY